MPFLGGCPENKNVPYSFFGARIQAENGKNFFTTDRSSGSAEAPPKTRRGRFACDKGKMRGGAATRHLAVYLFQSQGALGRVNTRAISV